MEYDRFILLLGKKIGRDISNDESIELSDMLLKNEQFRKLHDQLLANSIILNTDNKETEASWYALFYKMKLEGKFSDDGEFDSIISEKNEAIFENADSVFKNKLNITWKTVSLMTLLLACIALVLGINFYKAEGPIVASDALINNIRTEKGSKTHLILPDGSKVWMNADSKLSYDFGAGNSNRTVFLQGEAYFDVAHNEKLPFIIKTGKFSIKVLGTAFNVKAYTADNIAETILYRGKIEVELVDKPGEVLTLKPNEKLVVKNSIVAADNSDLNNLMSSFEIKKLELSEGDSVSIENIWRNNILKFDNQRFELVANDLERHFDVVIHFEQEEIKDYKYSGVVGKESIDEILEYLSLSKKFNYIKKNDTIYIAK